MPRGGYISANLRDGSQLIAPAKVCDKAGKAAINLEQLEEALHEAKLSAELREKVVAEMRKCLDEDTERLKVITETIVIGPDGKVVTGGKDGLDSKKLKELLSGLEDGDIKELLEGNQDAIVSGKVVIIDQNGNRVEKKLGEGEALPLVWKKALENLPLEVEPEKEGAEKPADKADTAEQLKELTEKVSELQALLEELAEKQK